MEYVVVGICIVAEVAIVALLIYRRKRMSSPEGENKSDDELVIRLERLSVGAISDESKLIEITDSKVLARVNNLVPGLAQAGVAGANAV